MFEFKFADKKLQRKVRKLDFPTEVCQELPQFLEALRQKGEIAKVDYFLGNINRIDAHTFEMQYVSDPINQIVTILDIQIKSIELLKTRFSIPDSWDDKDILEDIPQCDKPQKMIKTLELIHQGLNSSYELGLKLGSKAKQNKDVARHGQYALSTLEELRLIERNRKGRKINLNLTNKGELIAKAPDQETQTRLLIEAMLNYRPVWLIMGAVTEGGKELTDELVKEIAYRPEDHLSDTSNRRSQTLKNWVKFISKFTGIPICLKEKTLQLTIPLIYGNYQSQENL
ncbi:putative transcriptional regulator [Rippkaea orientalis PCC 8801]|uniref:Putative transcriptional regulator n=1 Tax=Rippkaea orientalis (strain PCC 8801 / RF-1) TaxID=41431 RepID=B7JW36_RIPO1|nr:transcriptional regulator [Rippkaea orientalis]ACK65725.1 putative transcriptional regulator [Rippkaea orientalis PCC 8801]